MRTITGWIAGAAATFVALLSFAPDAGSQNIQVALPQVARAPADNPTTPARVALGRILFWDPILSGHRDVACATCHHPRFAYAENRDLSIGVDGIGIGDRRRFASGSSIPLVKRNSPTVVNVAFNGADEGGRHSPADAPMFWDVRVRSLELQALEPIKSLEEMRGRAYTEDKAVDTVIERLAAIPERSLLANNSPFDRYRRGDSDAMSASALRGMRRFERIGCIRCHTGPMFSDYKLHVLGVPDNPDLPQSDTGAVTERYAFRTASLRNLRWTAPYMHNGMFRTLEDVLEFYDDVDSRRVRARDRNVNVSREQLDPLLLRLRGVDEDDPDLIAFLDSLNDDGFDRTIPAKVPSGLAVGGRIQ